MLVEALSIAARLIAPLPTLEDRAPETAYMVLGPRVSAPVGYVRFCARRPDQCAPQAPEAPSDADTAKAAAAGAREAGASHGTGARIDGAAWRVLEAVNRKVNDALTPMSDEAAFGRSNYWTLPIEDEGRAVGNCKHFALEKRAALIAAGVSPSALFLAVVRTRQGELHAVLIAATDRGEVVLDNLSSQIRTWRETGYRWLARQGPGGPLAWYAVSGAASLASAARGESPAFHPVALQGAVAQSADARLLKVGFVGDAKN